MSDSIQVYGKIILASSSARRRRLMAMMGFPCEIQPGTIDETLRQGELPRTHVQRLSLEKAQQPAGRFPDAWILGADTIVVTEGRILGKPSTEAEAASMLNMLNGKTHQVFTGIALCRASSATQMSEVVVSDVLFKHIPTEEIMWYIRTGEPFGKAGGYALQGRGSFFVREVRGSYTNVIGLPLCETVEMLKLAGAIRFTGVDDGG